MGRLSGVVRRGGLYAVARREVAQRLLRSAAGGGRAPSAPTQPPHAARGGVPPPPPPPSRARGCPPRRRSKGTTGCASARASAGANCRPTDARPAPAAVARRSVWGLAASSPAAIPVEPAWPFPWAAVSAATRGSRVSPRSRVARPPRGQPTADPRSPRVAVHYRTAIRKLIGSRSARAEGGGGEAGGWGFLAQRRVQTPIPKVPHEVMQQSAVWYRAEGTSTRRKSASLPAFPCRAPDSCGWPSRGGGGGERDPTDASARVEQRSTQALLC